MHCSVMYPLQLIITVFISHSSPQNYNQANSARQQLKDIYALEIEANMYTKAYCCQCARQKYSQSAEQVVT